MMATPRTMEELLRKLSKDVLILKRRASVRGSSGGGGIYAASDAADRNARYPSPFQGLQVIRLDKGWTEQYYEAYSATTNPGGASPAGWYPVSGALPSLIGTSKGTTSVPNATWVNLNSAAGSGTNHRNDGFVFGAGFIQVPYPGLYHVDVSAQFASSQTGATGDRLIRLGADGNVATYYGQNWLRLATGNAFSGSAQIRNVSALMPIQTALNIAVFQGTTGAMNVDLSNVALAYAGVLRTL